MLTLLPTAFALADAIGFIPNANNISKFSGSVTIMRCGLRGIQISPNLCLIIRHSVDFTYSFDEYIFCVKKL